VSDISVKLRVNGLRMPDYGQLLVDGSDALWKAEQRIAHLEALIADAPHSISCKEGMRAWDSPTDFEVCTCWKSRALDTKEKSND
jgi:hypothetical protein